jgi:hypothetical protein
MKSEAEAPDDGRAIRREQVGRNPTPRSLRRGQLYGFPKPHTLGAPKRSDGGTPSSDSEIRCVSHKVAQGSQSGAYRLITIRAIGRTVSPYRSGVKQRLI